MLTALEEHQVRIPAWDSLPVRTQLPIELRAYFEKDGPMPVKPDSRRGYHRWYLRMKVVLLYQGQYCAAYVSDLSRSGIEILSPVDVEEGDLLTAYTPEGRVLTARVKNCIRLEDGCYRCGASHDNGQQYDRR
jgi:hypothetical protein